MIRFGPFSSCLTGFFSLASQLLEEILIESAVSNGTFGVQSNLFRMVVKKGASNI